MQVDHLLHRCNGRICSLEVAAESNLIAEKMGFHRGDMVIGTRSFEDRLETCVARIDDLDGTSVRCSLLWKETQGRPGVPCRITTHWTLKSRCWVKYGSLWTFKFGT